MALQNVGDYSDKIEGSYGYYIIQYTSDVVEGAVDMETVHDSHFLLLPEQQAEHRARRSGGAVGEGCQRHD